MSKGSGRRPRQISTPEYLDRWDATFAVEAPSDTPINPPNSLRIDETPTPYGLMSPAAREALERLSERLRTGLTAAPALQGSGWPRAPLVETESQSGGRPFVKGEASGC